MLRAYKLVSEWSKLLVECLAWSQKPYKTWLFNLKEIKTAERERDCEEDFAEKVSEAEEYKYF